MARTVLWLAFLSVIVLAPPPLGAQEQERACDVPRHEGFTSIILPNDTRVLYFSRPTIRCPGGTWITADSAVVYESTRYNQLFGNVVFVEEDSRLTADRAQYFEREGRLVAWGDPILTDQAEGSVIRGDHMVFVRAGEWQPDDLLTVTGERPHATLYPTRRPEPHPPPAPPPDSIQEGIPPPVPDSLVRPTSRETEVTRAEDTSAMVASQEPAERVPYEVYAQRIILEGSRYFRAAGSVVITRDSLDAAAEVMVFDQEMGVLSLLEAARVKTPGTDLAADSIRLDLMEDEIREVHARSNAVLESEDVRMLAPILRLYFTEGELELLVGVRDAVADSLFVAQEEEGEPLDPEALPTLLPEVVRELGLPGFPRRPLALAEDFMLLADSIEVRAPGEVLDEVWAMGRARGEATGRDSLNTPDTPSLAQVDWLEGDTIVATFTRAGAPAEVVADTILVEGIPATVVPDTLNPDRDPLPLPEESEAPPDTGEARYRLERLVARVQARSLYRMEPTDSTAREEGRLAVHYVIGDQIVMVFSQGEIERMEVENARGIHLEPVARQRREGEPAGGAPPTGSGGGRGR